MKDVLIERAIQIREKAYTPYSKFKVGAALLTEDDEIFVGCNIENASYPVGCCAERVAIFNAISAGKRNFKAMAVVANTDAPVSPCGSCRQVMSEFFSNSMPIYLSNINKDVLETNIEQLLPGSFQPSHLTEGK